MAAELYLPPSEWDFYSHKFVPTMLHVGFGPKNICKFFFLCLWECGSARRKLNCCNCALRCHKVYGGCALWMTDGAEWKPRYRRGAYQYSDHTELSLLKSEVSPHLVSTERTLNKAPNQQTARNSFLITFLDVPLRWVSLRTAGFPRETCE